MHCDSYSSQLLRKFNTLPAAAAVYATLEIKELRLACVNMTPGIGTLAFWRASNHMVLFLLQETRRKFSVRMMMWKMKTLNKMDPNWCSITNMFWILKVKVTFEIKISFPVKNDNNKGSGGGSFNFFFFQRLWPIICEKIWKLLKVGNTGWG